MKKWVVLGLMITGFLLSGKKILAAMNPIDLDALSSSVLGLRFTNLGDIISALLPYFYAFAGVGLLLLLIWGGFKYLTSAGDPKKTEGAKGTITAAVIGFAIVIAAYWLTQIVNYIFGLGVQVP